MMTNHILSLVYSTFKKYVLYHRKVSEHVDVQHEFKFINSIIFDRVNARILGYRIPGKIDHQNVSLNPIH